MNKYWKAAYLFALAYVMLSPIFRINERAPSIIQRWPMYTGTRRICTLRFFDPQRTNPKFHDDTVRRLNNTLFRPADMNLNLRDEFSAARLLRIYCANPQNKERHMRYELYCFQDDMWKDKTGTGEVLCKD